MTAWICLFKKFPMRVAPCWVLPLGYNHFGGGDDGLLLFLFPCNPATNNHADAHHWASPYSHHLTSARLLLIQPISRLGCTPDRIYCNSPWA